MESHSGKVKKREKACEVCGKMFFTMKHLRTHLLRHKDPKFVCDFEGCTKKFFKSIVFDAQEDTYWTT